MGVGATGGRGDGVGRHELGRHLRLARADPAARPGDAPRRRGRRLAGGRRPHRARLRPGAAPGRGPRRRRATRSPSSSGSTEPPPPGAIALVGRSLNGGFVGGPDGLTFVTDRELFGTVRVRRPKALRRVVPRDILERLSPGDLVVHIDHGVARYEQMLRRGGEGEERDYLELSFAGGDRIFVPVEQIARVTRYAGGERPQLSKLGGAEWLRAKQRVRKAVADLADELLALYAARTAPRATPSTTTRPGRGSWRRPSRTRRPSTSCGPPPRSRPTWSASSRWTGSSSATSATARPRSRCAAAFKATQDGKQVAVLVPTTVLAAQHHATFSQRFAAFPLEVRILSRFVSAQGAGGDDRRARGRHGRHRHRHAPPAAARTSSSRTSASSSSTRSSASASPPRSGSSSSAARSTC